MSATGLEVFDKTLQTTHIWLDEISEEIGPDRKLAWKVLSVVLHKLRDRLPVNLSVHLGAQLPLLVRGAYYDQFEPARQPVAWSLDELVHEVSRWLSDVRPVNAREAVRAVFAVLSRHVPQGQIDKVKGSLPSDIRAFWDAAEERVVTPPEPRAARAG